MSPGRQWRAFGVMAVFVLFLVVLVLAAPAYGDGGDVVGRVFTLAELPDQAVPGSVGVSPGGTVWTVRESGGLWRVRPGALRPARVTAGETYNDLAVLRDGGLLLTQDYPHGVVWRRAPGGALTVVAGSLGDYFDPSLSTVDGGQATRTLMCSAGAVAALPQGGFVFVDRYGRAVRRVDVGGTISTLYAVTAAEAAYGCPDAQAEASERVWDVAVARDGAVLLVVGRSNYDARILRLAPSGSRKVLVAHLNVGSITAAPDGSVLLTSASGAPFPVRRLARGAPQPKIVLPGDVDPSLDEDSASLLDPFDLDGARARDFYGVYFAGVTVAPDGGTIAAAFDPAAIFYVAPASPKRLLAALDAASGQATAGGYAVTYRATRPGPARLVVRKSRGRLVASTDARAKTGLNTIGLRHRFDFATYDVRLTVTGREGHLARDAVRLFLGGKLSRGGTRRLVVPHEVDVGGGCSNCESDVRTVRYDGCRPLGPRRVDCRYSYQWGDRRAERTCVIASARLRMVGTLEVRRYEYECPAGEREPWPPDSETQAELLPQQP
jgi:hypothetical protein